jgi:anti-sigma-K factor RskA
MTTPDDEMDLLTAYALGALTPEEVALVSELLERRPELRPLLAELHATTDLLPAALPEVEPPADLRQRTLDYAVGRTPARGAVSAPQRQRRRGWLLGLGGLAASALLVAGLGWSQLIGLRQSQQQIVAALAHPEALVVLNGSGGSGTAARNADGSMLVIAQLPPLARDRVYQLWLIQGDNPPVSGGVFTVDPRGYGTLAVPSQSQALAADTFAITNEPNPGSAGPTTPVLVAGKVAPR